MGLTWYRRSRTQNWNSCSAKTERVGSLNPLWTCQMSKLHENRSLEFLASLSSADIFCCESNTNPCSHSILVLKHQQQPDNIKSGFKFKHCLILFVCFGTHLPVLMGGVDFGCCHFIAVANPRHPLALFGHLFPPSCKNYANIILRRSPSGWRRSRASPSPQPPPEYIHTGLWGKLRCKIWLFWKSSKMENLIN